MSANSVSSSVLIDCIEEICLYFDRGEVGEVDFMPTTTSPFVLVDSKVLGISYGILKPLYKYVYTEQFRVYSQYKASSHSDPLSLHQMYQFSTVALVVKGDLAMAYNIRKVVLFHNPTLLSKELIFLQAIFTKHPKSPSGWEHRRWCYNRRYTPSPITPPPYTPIHTHTMHTTNPPNIPSPAPSPAMRLSASEVETERELCRAGSERSPKNYWAWTHRLWLLVHMTQHQLDDELSFVLTWLTHHISDHSAAQHFIQLLSLILHHADNKRILCYILNISARTDEGDNTKGIKGVQESESSNGCNRSDDTKLIIGLPELQLRFLLQCWLDVQNILESRPGHDSLWCVRKGMFSLFHFHFSSHQSDLDCLNSFSGPDSGERRCVDNGMWNCVKSVLDDLVILLQAENKQTSPPSHAEHDHKGISSLTSLLLSDVHFVYKQVHVALFAEINKVVWDSKLQAITALRYLVFILRRTLSREQCIGMGMEENIGSIVRYLEMHDVNRVYLAYHNPL